MSIADSGKIAIWTGNGDDDLIVKRTSAVDYWDGRANGDLTGRCGHSDDALTAPRQWEPTWSSARRARYSSPVSSPRA